MTVNEPFESSDSVRAIPLAPEEPQAGDIAIVSGWGVEHVSNSIIDLAKIYILSDFPGRRTVSSETASKR